jgi:sterol desaturase/sphingolipid hydroxylase (fatty acid hydroxylase superfamily)
MIVTDKSSIITFAVPVFLLLIVIEYCYGKYKGKNTYRLNDTFTSLSLGMISRYPTMLNLGMQSLIFVYISKYLNVGLLSVKNPLTWVIAFLLYDLSYYWMHRMHHEIKILWATHSVHHHGEDYNLATALRQTSTGWLWKWIFYLPMIILGIPGEVFITVAGINLVYQFWVHTEHIGHLGFLEKIFITPMNHGIHHAKNKEYIDANYGGVFIIWDRMFGTYTARMPDVEPVYGTVSALQSWNPIWANFQIFTTMVKDTIKT